MKNKLKFLTKNSLDRKIKTKWFKIANILILILLIGIVNIDKIVSLFGGDFQEKTTIKVIAENNIYETFANSFKNNATLLKEIKNYEISQSTEDADQLMTTLNSDEETIILVLQPDNINYLQAKMISYDEVKTLSKQLIMTSLDNVKNEMVATYSGLSEEQITSLTSPVNIEISLTNPNAQNDANKDLIIGTIAMLFILPCFFLITLLVQMIGAEVNDEKSTRSMEIIISNVSPKVHFLSKIFSSTLFVIIQGLLIILYAFIAVIMRLIINKTAIIAIGAETSSQIKDLITMINNTKVLSLLCQGLPIILILFVVSFLAYAIVSGVLASMTTSTEDFQQLQTPLIIILLLGYYLSMMASVFEGSIFIKIAGYIPMLSFLIAPTLFLLNQFSIIELCLSTIISSLATWLLFKYGLRIYKVGILNYSSTKLWKKMFKSLKNKE